MTPRVAILTYSTKPRGGVVHSLSLTEALHHLGHPVRLFALGDPGGGFFRDTDAPHTILPAPSSMGTLTDRVYRAAEALRKGLASVAGDYDLVHAQDCIAARAALDLRESRSGTVVVRTVHHVDEFTTPALVECQRRSIVEPDHVLVVSEFWRRVLLRDFGVAAGVVTNGVDAARFARSTGTPAASDLRRRVGAEDRFLFVTVGGIEPRKGSVQLLEACGRLKHSGSASPVLAVLGGHSFQDHEPYRRAALERAGALDLVEGDDLHVLGTVSEEELVSWYHAADAFVLPSVNEGWGLAVLEALAASLPVIVTSIPVFAEYLTHGRDALLVPPSDAAALAQAMRETMEDGNLRARLSRAGPISAARFTWEQAARRHAEAYAEMTGAPRAPAEEAAS